MALFALLRLARAGDFKTFLLAALTVVALIGVFWLAQPMLRPLGNLNLIIFFVGVVGFCVFAGVPIGFSLRDGDLRLSGADDADAVDGAGRPDGRGHVPPDPAVGAAVRVPRPADRNDRHGARDGGLPGAACSGTSGAACTTCWSARCIWCPAFPDRRPPTWRRSHRCCFPK